MKRRIVISLLAMAVLVLAACGCRFAAVSAAAEAVQVQVEDYAGIYKRTVSEEIGGSVLERSYYVILNQDRSGYMILQGVGTVTWDENQMTDSLGLSYNISVMKDGDALKLLVYDFQDSNGVWIPSVYTKTDCLPADMGAMLAEYTQIDAKILAAYMTPGYPGVYQRTVSEEIGGSVVERSSYIVLNADHTGWWIAQEIGAATWTEGLLTDSFGLTYSIEVKAEDGAVQLLLFEFMDNSGAWIPTVFERIDQLPADIAAMIAG